MSEMTGLIPIPGLMLMKASTLIAVFFPIIFAIWLTIIVPAMRKHREQKQKDNHDD